MFIIQRKRSGVCKATVTAEISIWSRILKERGFTPLMHRPDVKLQLDAMYPPRLNKAQLHVRAPLTQEMLKFLVEYQLHRARHNDRPEINVRNAALLQLSFYALLRRSEVAPLRRKDLIWDREAAIAVIRIRSSKTDQIKKGAYVPVFMGQREQTSDPAYAVIRLQALLDAQGIPPTGPLFPAYVAKDREFRGELSLDAITQLLGKIIADIEKQGFDFSKVKNRVKLSSHSLRRGGATFYASIGMSSAFVKFMGRWQSACYLLYTDSIWSRAVLDLQKAMKAQ